MKWSNVKTRVFETFGSKLLSTLPKREPVAPIVVPDGGAFYCFMIFGDRTRLFIECFATRFVSDPATP
jgi:hypothetical protein|tara:strand:- start:28 stop:231 length:204 start_codon:yes stop_codon:yes gene_type:complete